MSTVCRLPLVKGRGGGSEERGALWLLSYLSFLCRNCASAAWCSSSTIHPRVIVLFVFKWQDWVSQKQRMNFQPFQKALFQRCLSHTHRHTRLVQGCCAVSYCSVKGHLLATFWAAPHNYWGSQGDLFGQTSETSSNTCGASCSLIAFSVRFV